MKFYPENYDVELTINFTDMNGSPITPVSLSAKLFDGDDVLISDIGSISVDPGDTEKTITIPRQLNVLGVGELRAARILRVGIETPAGTINRSLSYAIETEQRMVILTNTFVSLESAEFIALDMPNKSGWASASDDQKRAALTEAFRRITRIPMKYVPYDPATAPSGYDTILPKDASLETVIDRDKWSLVTHDVFNTKFPARFKNALRRAQFIEANELLQGDGINQKHRAGIMTETIGESSITLRSGKVDYGVSSDTLNALTGYIFFDMRTIRT